MMTGRKLVSCSPAPMQIWKCQVMILMLRIMPTFIVPFGRGAERNPRIGKPVFYFTGEDGKRDVALDKLPTETSRIAGAVEVRLFSTRLKQPLAVRRCNLA